jgi:hypothetical protein
MRTLKLGHDQRQRRLQGHDQSRRQIRDSVPNWDAFTAKRPPERAPNVLVVLHDDTGIAAWSPYGGRINMPTMDRLAANA